MKKRNIVYIIVICLSFFQCYILLSNNKNMDTEDINAQELNSISTRKSVKNIKDIKKDFSDYKTLQILKYNKLENGSWKLKCSLTGNREDVLKDLEKINFYEITNYSLTYENNNILIDAELTYK
ncbi:hypothetical protein R0131_15215 [Clostridium sp. AL.422]|uniref:hypothetical protein n=1 Tax=Clostridium TaxID=1485 RepID=UPI00293DF716|nr:MULTISPECIES: hypothetical protein [unclassified Clostridium]MDV4152176.1 hypothetical protein [Clostridium sp. AL.422]